MLGLADLWVFLAYLASILSALVCLVYGFLNWNAESDEPVAPEEQRWEKDEQAIEETLG